MQYYAGLQKITPDSLIGKGGEGSVYSLKNRPEYVFKKYNKKSLTEEKHKKIAAMISNNLNANTSNVAFPVELVFQGKSTFAGFVMKFVSGNKPLHELYAPGSRKKHFPDKDYRFLVRTALNISRAVSQVHAVGCVIGDINHSGILVSPEATANLIDADSFQFSDGKQEYLCEVGVPEYTPPELQGKRLSKLTRKQSHDAFGLGVIIFQLLFMGRHPYSGRFVGNGEMPIEKAIREHRFVYSLKRNTNMKVPPAICDLSVFPRNIQSLFENCFDTSPSARPSAVKWVEVLTELEKSLVKCKANPKHFFPNSTNYCPWCKMENLTGVSLFESRVDSKSFVKITFTEPADITSAIQQIGKLQFPNQIIFRPQAPTQIKNVKPNHVKISEIKGKANESLFYGLLMVAGGIAITVLSSFSLSIFGVPLAIIGGIKINNSRSFAKDYFANERRLKLGSLDSCIKNSARKVNLSAYDTVWKLKGFASDYANLKIAYNNLEEDYKNTRRWFHLDKYLSGKLIRNANIPQVLRESVDNLTSYGIETAADVKAKSSDLQSVPSIGPVRSSRLLEWLNSVEKSFSFDDNSKYTAVDISIINNKKKELIRVRDDLFSSMKSELKKVKTQNVELQNALTNLDSNLMVAFKDYYQAEANWNVFGSSVPQNIPSEKISIQTRKVETRITKNAWQSESHNMSSVLTARILSQLGHTTKRKRKPTTTTHANAPSCPKCGSSMVRRLARRGYNAGSHFWGCSQYPSCRGTRN